LIDEVVLDGQTYYVRRSERFLPQGAPSSPALTNLLCRRLDARLEGMAKQLGATYTRYADDMTISLNSTANIQRVLWQVQKVAQEEGFTVHPDKVQVMRLGDRKEVTGIVVNEKLNVPKDTLKRFRAVLHKIETGQAQDVQWGKGSLKQAIQGFANYVRMVNPQKGQALVDKVQQLLQDPKIKAQLQGLQKPSKNSLEKAENQGQTTETQPKDELMVSKKKKTEDKPWWSLW
jgi:retron-type reverse transcriptase